MKVEHTTHGAMNNTHDFRAISFLFLTRETIFLCVCAAVGSGKNLCARLEGGAGVGPVRRGRKANSSSPFTVTRRDTAAPEEHTAFFVSRETPSRLPSGMPEMSVQRHGWSREDFSEIFSTSVQTAFPRKLGRLSRLYFSRKYKNKNGSFTVAVHTCRGN